MERFKRRRDGTEDSVASRKCRKRMQARRKRNLKTQVKNRTWGTLRVVLICDCRKVFSVDSRY
jgi:hypothetical protein